MGEVNIDQLGFEILDTIFSYFSGEQTASSYYANQDLLSFCQVSRSFYRVAKLHLSRYIAIASAFKAQQILSVCSSDPTFGSRLHHLVLIWPEQGKYSTRRSGVLSESDFHSLLSQFPSMRSLELVCLPYPRLDNLIQAQLASTSSLANIRSLKFTTCPYRQRKEEYQIIAALLSLTPQLEHLEILNMPLAVPEIVDLPQPIFRLKSFSLKLSGPRAISSDMLEWILQSTIQAQSCRSLLVWLSTLITEKEEFDGPVKPSQGFTSIEGPLAELAPSLTRFSLLGLRDGQASTILKRTTEKLQHLTLYDTFGYSPDLLNDLPYPTNITTFSMLENPHPRYGARQLSVDPLTRALFGNMNTTTHPGVASSSGNANGATHGNTSSGTLAAATEDTHIIHVEVPISSTSFTSELGTLGKLEKLKTLNIPENARFGRRGKWLNKETIKMCKRNGIWINETRQ